MLPAAVVILLRAVRRWNHSGCRAHAALIQAYSLMKINSLLQLCIKEGGGGV